ncbi:unnamed protein product [Closterium sp. NIES-54]
MSQTHQWRLGPQPSPLTEPLLGGTSQAGIAVAAEGASSRSGPQISSSSLSPIRWILPGFVSFRSQGGLSGPAVVPATHSSAQACAPASTPLPPPPLLAPSSATVSPPPRPIASLAESSAIAAAAAGLALSGESSLERLETGGAAGGGEQQYATGAREWRSAGKGATAGGAGRGTAAWEGEAEGEGDGESGHAIARRLEWSLPVCKGSEAGRVSEECEQDGGKERSRKRNGQRRPILRWIWRSASVSSEEREGSAEREEGDDEESEEGSDGSDDESDEREGEEEEREEGVAEAAAKAVAPVVSARRAGRGRSRAKTSGLWRKEAMVAEAKLQVTMAWPMMAANLLQNLMTLIPLAFVGRLGPLPLAAASIATSFANVTGHILLVRPPLCSCCFKRSELVRGACNKGARELGACEGGVVRRGALARGGVALFLPMKQSLPHSLVHLASLLPNCLSCLPFASFPWVTINFRCQPRGPPFPPLRPFR